MTDYASKILGLKLPKAPEIKPRTFKGGKRSPPRPPGYTITSQKQLRALRAGAVPEGHILNPYGQGGFINRVKQPDPKTQFKLAWRPEAMKRKRLRMKEKKAIALEAHELQQIARENATLAMCTLVEISGNKRAPEATRIAASSVILDRAYGKASQTSITANVGNGKTSELTADELDKRVERALKRVEDITNRAPKTKPSKKRSINLRLYN